MGPASPEPSGSGHPGRFHGWQTPSRMAARCPGPACRRRQSAAWSATSPRPASHGGRRPPRNLSATGVARLSPPRARPAATHYHRGDLSRGTFAGAGPHSAPRSLKLLVQPPPPDPPCSMDVHRRIARTVRGRRRGPFLLEALQAQASIRVPSTVKCSADRSGRAFAWASTRAKKARAMSPWSGGSYSLVISSPGPVLGSWLASGAGPGGGPHVSLIDVATGVSVRGFFASTSGFTGGAHVAVGDVNGDGFPDVVTGAGPGGGPHVKVFDGVTGAEIQSFFAYAPGSPVASTWPPVTSTATARPTSSPAPARVAAPTSGSSTVSRGAEIEGFFAYAPGFTTASSSAASEVGDGRRRAQCILAPG